MSPPSSSTIVPILAELERQRSHPQDMAKSAAVEQSGASSLATSRNTTSTWDVVESEPAPLNREDQKKTIADQPAKQAQKGQLENVLSQQSASKDASIPFLRAQNVALSEEKASLMAQIKELQGTLHQTPASDGRATAVVHALQKSLSDQQALTKQAEAKLSQQEAFVRQVEASLDDQKAFTKQAEYKLFEQEALAQQAQIHLFREMDSTEEAEASLEEQKALTEQVEERLIGQLAATDSAEAYLLYMTCKIRSLNLSY